jgi:hypothetical protein
MSNCITVPLDLPEFRGLGQKGDAQRHLLTVTAESRRPGARCPHCGRRTPHTLGAARPSQPLPARRTEAGGSSRLLPAKNFFFKTVYKPPIACYKG